MIKSYKRKVKQRIENYCETHYQKLSKNNMKMGNGMFNNRCQLNAVQQVKEGLMEEVYSCICSSSTNFPIVHFINKNKDGFYIDNTLGFDYENWDYYLIKRIDKSEFSKMNDMLMNTKKSLIGLHSNKLLNKLFGVNEENIGI